MPIFRITYLSGEFHVKGYLGIPTHAPLHLITDITQWLDAQRMTYTRCGNVSALNLKPSIDTVFSQKQWPGFLYCRGGIGRVGMVNLDWVQEFADFGFVVFAPSYRGADGGEGRDEFGGADREDTCAAFRLLASMPWVHHQRISVMGFSRGSINAALTVCAMPEVYKLILWGGVSDLAETYKERVDLRRMLKRVVGGTPTRVPDSYRIRSPIAMADELHCPTLIVHGTNDAQVDVSHAHRIYQSLVQRSADVTMHTYYGCGHHLPTPVHQAVVNRMFDWLIG